MTAFRQTWICRQCGHRTARIEHRPKYGGSTRHVAEIERRARCTSCGGRGCEVVETLVSQIGTWLDPEFVGPHERGPQGWRK